MQCIWGTNGIHLKIKKLSNTKTCKKTEHFLGQCLPYFKGTKSIELQTQKMLYLLSEWNLMARKMYAPDQRNKRKRQFWFEITECLLINVVGQQ